jgi:hypothetical protein
MSRFLKLELWLFAIPGFIVISVIAGLSSGALTYVGKVVTWLAIVWMILAIAWMFKMIVRRVRG